MTVPEVRRRLQALALELACPELATLAAELRRRPGAQGPKTSTPMTAHVAERIIALRQQHPYWSQQRIANAVGVNPGRVSEVLHGFRT